MAIEGKYSDDAALVTNLRAVLKDEVLNSPAREERYQRLRSFFEEVKSATDAQLRDRAFLQHLWDENPVAKVGNGTVKIAPAIDNPEFVEWFVHAIRQPLPTGTSEIELHLVHLYDEATKRLAELCKAVPRLKLNRVLCSFFPNHYTSIADEGALTSLYKELGESGKSHPVHRHLYIRQRIDANLDQLPEGRTLDVVRRTYLPWLLYERIGLTNDEGDLDADGDGGLPNKDAASSLIPQPASLRRKGLTSMKGGFQGLLNYLPALDAGLTREEFIDVLRQANPTMAENSLRTLASVVVREWDLCARNDDVYKLTARGNRLLESLDPDEVKDQLLTRVLGIDHVLKALAAGPKSKTPLVDLLQSVNAGWTSDFMPSSILGWMIGLDVVRLNSEKHYELTERGHRWLEEIHWTPQFLDAPTTEPKPPKGPAQVEAQVSLPTWAQLMTRLDSLVANRLVFSSDLVARLHAGLWSHPSRHFAALSGLSGSGKTQLALNYAKALCNEAEDSLQRICIIPVQPGWFDPGPLLGYTSPVREGIYRETEFLKFLLRAAGDPSEPYVVILDEMNLSHPEQYLAPILSAMETQKEIALHELEEADAQVPQKVDYPLNLAIIGTLNMDETTHGLSDKILDRAYTLEFWDIDINASPAWETVRLSEDLRARARGVLQGLHNALYPVRLHFGYRPVEDILRYLEFLSKAGMPSESALDDAIYAKVLPKLRGESSQRFTTALEGAKQVLQENGLQRCSRRVGGLLDSLKESGTALFWR